LKACHKLKDYEVYEQVVEKYVSHFFKYTPQLFLLIGDASLNHLESSFYMFSGSTPPFLPVPTCSAYLCMRLTQFVVGQATTKCMDVVGV